MIFNITILGVGFSLTSAGILFFLYVFFLKNVNRSWVAIASCSALMFCFSSLQWFHLQYFLSEYDVLSDNIYRFFLFMTPAFFYFFSRATLFPEAKTHAFLALHFSPLILNYVVRPEISTPLLFLVGVGYSVWFVFVVFGVRSQRRRFKMELIFFSLFSVAALVVLILGISLSYIPHHYFYVVYANSISIAFILVVLVLMVYPDILLELAEVARVNRAVSTLKGLDIDELGNKLEMLMSQSRLYQNENLNLPMVADALKLNPHQLSELVNSKYGVGFSRYIREQRILSAKDILMNEPDSSVLAISLEIGFKTQSNFYAAFKEVVGMSPGAYRKSLQK